MKSGRGGKDIVSSWAIKEGVSQWELSHAIL